MYLDAVGCKPWTFATVRLLGFFFWCPGTYNSLFSKADFAVFVQLTALHIESLSLLVLLGEIGFLGPLCCTLLHSVVRGRMFSAPLGWIFMRLGAAAERVKLLKPASSPFCVDASPTESNPLSLSFSSCTSCH